MRKDWMAVLCLMLLAGFVNHSTAQETKKVSCTGKVVNTQGEPIAGVKVKFYGSVYGAMAYSYDTRLVEEEVTTKADGAFSFSIIADTNGYRYGIILAEKQGLAIGWANWRMRAEEEFEIKLGEAEELTGVVVDESDKPIVEAEVGICLLVAGEGEGRRYLTGQVAPKFLSVKTDTAGKFAFTNLPADATAEFLVKKAGRATVSTFEPPSYSGEGLQFAAGQTDIKLVQPVEAKIEGVVVEKGTVKPVADVRLMVTQERNRPNFGQEPIVSKEDGTFSIDALAAGSYTLNLVPVREKLADWVAEPVEVVTETGKTKSGAKVEVSKGGLLEVVVTEAVSKKPVEKASVSIRDEDSVQGFYASTDKDGVARVRLAPGEYKISGVYKEGYSRTRQEEAVTIEEHKTARLDIQLTSPPKVAGVVRDEAGKPVEGANIKICPMGSRSEVKTNAEGKFEVSWDPRMWGGPQEMETVYYLVVRHPERNLAAAVEIEEDTKTLDIKLVPGVVFTGRVVDPNGKGITGAKINVMMRVSSWGSPITDWQKGRAVTDAEGNFEVKAIPIEHKYNVTVSAEGYGKKQVEALADDAVDNRLDVGQLTLAVANLSVSGIVVDANDKPVAGARISAYGEGQPDRHNIQTDAEGKFTIEKICAGRIRVSTNVSGMQRLYGNVETEGGAKDVKIVVGERPTASRYVLKQPPSLVGKPLPELEDLKIDLSAAEADDRMILLCFWDMQQRPSRHCITELAKRAEELAAKGVIVAAVQALKVDENALNEWVKKYNIPFPVGMVEGDEEKTRFTWGVQGLPWLILTNRQKVITANGFGPAELDENINAVTQK